MTDGIVLSEEMRALGAALARARLAGHTVARPEFAFDLGHAYAIQAHATALTGAAPPSRGARPPAKYSATSAM